MNPIKSLVPIAKWFLRVSVAIILYDFYFKLFEKFSFNSFEFFIAFVLIVCAVTIIVGGFLKNNTLTVVSGLVICVLSVLMIFVDGLEFDVILKHFVPAAIGFYFMARGNLG